MSFPWRIACILPLLLFLSGCTSRRIVELRLIAQFNTRGWAHDTAMESGSLYVADRQGGYLVFNAGSGYRNPKISMPVKDVISLCPNSGAPVLASRFEGIVALSREGKIAGGFSNGDIANAVEVRDGLAFAAYGKQGLVVVRVAGKSAERISVLPTSGWSHDIRLAGNMALMADWSGLRVVDIRNPEEPAQIGFLPSPATCISLAVEDAGDILTIALAEGHGGVALARMNPDGRLSYISRHSLGLKPSGELHPESGGWVHSVAWAGRHLLAANWKSGLAILDIQNLGNPRLVMQYPTSGTSLGVKAVRQPDGSYLVFLADGESGLRVFQLRG